MLCAGCVLSCDPFAKLRHKEEQKHRQKKLWRLKKRTGRLETAERMFCGENEREKGKEKVREFVRTVRNKKAAAADARCY